MITLKKYSFLLIAIIGLLACSNPGESETARSSVAQETAPDGEKIYKINCVTCHGLYGDMGASGAHDLTASQLSLDERIAVITNGRNAMMPFSSLLDEAEIRAVAEFTLTLAKNDKE